MKRTFILTSAVALAAITVFTSCGHSRVWANKEKNEAPRESARPSNVYRSAPAPRYAAAPLIISPSPGFKMARHQNGQYFHQNPQGLMYWKGFDNRFYLDKNQVDRPRYSKFEIKEWKRYARHSGK